MRNLFRLGIVAALVVITAAGAFIYQSGPQNAAAQDDPSAGVACDSTLYLLLVLAEEHYGFISSMDEATMATMPTWNYGPYNYLLQDTIAHSQMAAGEMTPEDQAYRDSVNTAVQSFMGLDTTTILQGYDASMGYTPSTDVTPLIPGNVANEAPECAALRTQLEQFLLSHIVAERQIGMMDMGTDGTSTDDTSTEATEEATEVATEAASG
jgi:hypothetical protein